MVDLQTKDLNVVVFWMAMLWKMLAYFNAILLLFGIFSRFYMLYQEKSGKPGMNC
jgi:hypothetical protein